MFRLEVLQLNRRTWFALCGATAFGLIAAGLVVQAIYRIAPCPLCIFQRLLYVIIGVIALLGVLTPSFGRWWSGLMAVVAVGGAAVAGQQSWMQAFPHLARECSYTDPNLIERLVDWLGMKWPAFFMATGFCSSKDWEFLGLSIANWSLVAFTGFTGMAVWLFRRRTK